MGRPGRSHATKAAALHELVAILDNEALQAVTGPGHSKHRSLIALVTAASHRNARRAGQIRLLTTTAVRVEAGISRRRPSAALLGSLRIRDVVLDSQRADSCAELSRSARATAVDATVAQAALAERGTRTTVSIYTADTGDLHRLVDAGGGGVLVRRV